MPVVSDGLTPLPRSKCAVSAILAILLAVAYIPRYIIVKRMYWAVPFAAHVFRPNFGWVGGFFVRQAFEFLYSVNVLRRLISSPFRRRLPDLYILGFPKSGTTSLANHLRDHPAMLGVDGIPFHDVLRKESHFLVGCAPSILVFPVVPIQEVRSWPPPYCCDAAAFAWKRRVSSLGGMHGMMNDDVV